MKKTSLEAAAVWLYQHGSDGVFDKNGVLLAAGESGPFMRSTWNRLIAEDYAETYRLSSMSVRGRPRLRLTQKGIDFAKSQRG